MKIDYIEIGGYKHTFLTYAEKVETLTKLPQMTGNFVTVSKFSWREKDDEPEPDLTQIKWIKFPKGSEDIVGDLNQQIIGFEKTDDDEYTIRSISIKTKQQNG